MRPVLVLQGKVRRATVRAPDSRRCNRAALACRQFLDMQQRLNLEVCNFGVFRSTRDLLFKQHPQSPLNESQREIFRNLQYFRKIERGSGQLWAQAKRQMGRLGTA